MIGRGEVAITAKPARRSQSKHLSSLSAAGQAEA